ncbi:N-acetylneuraminate 9-O-acetyltransferase [Purpureocillium lavendulum]|uniref:N-acetylneuraminate 9-O-acetyltransferase n=1 Tax=Purpureocillium lavendulum TaxID=1247861 RepID=A0AB34FIL9_9HYPO|nr:N-acetylneuraminate 9-O-acetyltransferase [Purpureocillium lavendulum]
MALALASPAMSTVAARGTSTLVVLLVLLGAVFHGVLRHSDPYRCRQLLEDGSWLDPPDANGSRAPFKNWQPRGCKLRQYSKEDIHECIEHRHMVFSGDSTTRQVFWAMGRLLDRATANERRRVAGIHESYDMEFDGIRMLQIWNPFLRVGDDTKEEHDLTYQLNLWQRERHGKVPVADQQSAALTLLGAGSWYALTMFHDDAVGNFSEAFLKVTDVMQSSDLPPFGSAPMTPRDGLGSEVFVAPVAPPFYDQLPPSRTGPKGIHKGEVEDIDKFLDSVADEKRIPLLNAYPALSRDQPAAMVDINDTGFHVIDSVAEVKATILLNARCNAKLHALDGSPYDGTCCTDYGRTTFVQSILLGLGVMYVSACVAFEVLDMLGRNNSEQPFFDMSACMFVTALLACFLADRTQVFAKGSKEFVASEFAILSLLAAVVGVVTVRRMSPPRSDSSTPPVALEDAPPLSRDQTDEWKGWMQAAILIYHWTGASRSLPIYICIRLMVAAYLFQVGYGHTVYFLTKKDFSFKRVAAVLLRLNLLSCALPYVMNTNYMLYYFAPLVSFWFVVVYATLAIGSGFNDKTNAVVAKIVLSAFAVAAVFLLTPLSEWIFAVLRSVFRIEWDLHEWQFRVSLDILVVYVGMLAGMASARSKLWNRLLAETKWPGLAGLFVLAGYWYLSNGHFTVKQDYNWWHPYISFVPILGFIAARNVAAPARVFYSRAFAWLGRCSLETFTLQFHLYLASDTKGVLLLDGLDGAGSLAMDRWRHLVVIVPFFLWISHTTAEATGSLTKLLTSEAAEQSKSEAGSSNSESLLPVQAGLGRFKVPPILLRLAPKAVVSDLRVRMAGLLALMWLLNLVFHVASSVGKRAKRDMRGLLRAPCFTSAGTAILMLLLVILVPHAPSVHGLALPDPQPEHSQRGRRPERQQAQQQPPGPATPYGLLAPPDTPPLQTVQLLPVPPPPSPRHHDRAAGSNAAYVSMTGCMMIGECYTGNNTCDFHRIVRHGQPIDESDPSYNARDSSN